MMKDRPLKWHRIRKRLRLHHLPLFLLTSIATFACYVSLDSKDAIFKLSMATAYPGLALLGATLITGPLKVLRRLTIPVSDDLTRDIGIWAGIVGILHVVFGLQVHMRGRMWLLFVTEEMTFPYIRFDMFGAANYTGVVVTLVLLLLFATSNDRSLSALGTQKWKRVQRWNYGLFAFLVAHGVLYQVLEKRVVPLVIVFAGLAAVAVVFQVGGFVYRRRKEHST